MQLPVQALSVRVVDAVGAASGTVDDMVRVAQAVRRRRVPLRRGVPPRRDPARARRDDVDAVVRPGRDARVPRGAHDAHAADDQRVRRRVPAPARRPPRRSRRSTRSRAGALIVGVGAGHVEGEFDALGVPFAGRGAITDEAIDAIIDALTDEWTDDGHVASTSGSARVRCSSRTRRSGSADRASPRCAGSRDSATAGSRRPRRSTGCPTTSRTILRERDQVRPGAVPEIGYHLRSSTSATPTWDLPEGRAARLGRIGSSTSRTTRLGAIGVSHLQVRFAARSRDELCDQIARVRRRGRPAPHAHAR